MRQISWLNLSLFKEKHNNKIGKSKNTETDIK